MPPKSLAVNTRSLKELEKAGVRSAGVNSKLASGAKSSIIRSSQANKYEDSPRLRAQNDSPYDKKSVNNSNTGKSDTLERAIQHQVQLRKMQQAEKGLKNGVSKKRLLGEDFLNDLKLPNVDQKGPGSLNLNPYGSKASDELSRKLSEFDNRGVGVAQSGIRNKQYNRLGPTEGIRYKSNNNYDLSEKAHKINLEN